MAQTGNLKKKVGLHQHLLKKKKSKKGKKKKKEKKHDNLDNSVSTTLPEP